MATGTPVTALEYVMYSMSVRAVRPRETEVVPRYYAALGSTSVGGFFAQFTIYNGQLTIVESLRDIFEYCPLADSFIVNCQLSIVNCAKKPPTDINPRAA
jgi:hypothetical protein